MKARPMDTDHFGHLLSGMRSLHASSLCIFKLTCQGSSGRICSGKKKARLRPGPKETFLAARRIQNAAPPLKFARITIDQILADSSARKAFDKLCSKGADRKELEEFVLHAVYVRGFRSFDPLFVSGMSRASLAKLPKEIRAIALKLVLIAENPDLDPPPALEQPARELPEALRRYADNLEATIKHFRLFLQKHPRYYDLQTAARRKLLQYVNKSTGHPHHAWVADVLSGTPVVGTDEPVVDSSSLRKIYPTRR
jgi:hypothetical protein